jgi:hypothetical protein
MDAQRGGAATNRVAYRPDLPCPSVWSDRQGYWYQTNAPNTNPMESSPAIGRRRIGCAEMAHLKAA